MPEMVTGHLVKRIGWTTLAVFIVAVAVPNLAAQTTIPGPAVNVEIFFPTTGTNAVCVSPGEAFSARVWVSPGTGTTSCTPDCGTTVQGGSSHLASALIDVSFDSTHISFANAQNNPDTEYAAVDGLIQDNSSQGRVGWALAGDWTPDADASAGTLATACTMNLLDNAGWVFEVQFTAQPLASGTTILHIRRETEAPLFALSFADMCGTDAFTKTNGGIGEIRDAVVYISDSCSDVLFFDGFETATTSLWSGDNQP